MTRSRVTCPHCRRVCMLGLCKRFHLAWGEVTRKYTCYHCGNDFYVREVQVDMDD